MTTIEREDNGENGRFIIYEDGELAGEMVYSWKAKAIFIIEHTSVDEKFKGKGLGRKLVMESVEYARNNHLKIVPVCAYAKRIFDMDTRIHDVLA